MSNSLGAIHSQQQWTDRVFVSGGRGRTHDDNVGKEDEEESRVTKYAILIVMESDQPAVELMNNFADSVPTAETVAVFKCDGLVQKEIDRIMKMSA